MENVIQPNEFKDIPVAGWLDQDPFMAIESSESLIVSPRFNPVEKYAGRIILRGAVAMNLQFAARNLNKKQKEKNRNRNLGIEIIEGYRSMERQAEKFNQAMAEVESQIPDVEERRLFVHTNMYAIPELAGHPTGGAVDVQIVDLDTNKPLDFGTEIWTFAPETALNSPNISQEAKANRKLLCAAMEEYGFLFYGGEWWHCSLGDKEWAGLMRRKGYKNCLARYAQKYTNELKFIK